EHDAYDPAYANRLWHILVQVDRVFTASQCAFVGKSSPVNFFWGSFDLAATRFSGRRAPPREGPEFERDAYSHEVISHGFWPGSGALLEPAFYAYAVPEPPGLKDSRAQPIWPGGTAVRSIARPWRKEAWGQIGSPRVWRTPLNGDLSAAREPSVRCARVRGKQTGLTQGSLPVGADDAPRPFMKVAIAMQARTRTRAHAASESQDSGVAGRRARFSLPDLPLSFPRE